MRRAVVVSVFCALALLVACGPALAGVRLECPDTVGRGLPFFVRLVSDERLTGVRLAWGPMESRPEVRRVGDSWQALVMLGTGADAKAGTGRVRAAFDGPGGPLELTRPVRILDRHFPEQHLKVARKMVHLSDDDLLRHTAEKQDVRRVLDNPARERAWDGRFVRPLPGAVTSAYGLRRFFNGEPRSPHRGIDLRGRMGEPVRVIAPGRVALAAEHFFGGNSVYVDHGQGLVSMYCHLSEIDVAEGDVVGAGDVIGKVGMTGRVTGPHLHFGLCVYGELVDPMPLVTGKLKP